MNSASCLIKQEYFKRIDSSTRIEEFIKEGNISMKCKVVKEHEDDDGTLYHFFHNKKEHSKIPFFDIGRFPDGIFIKFDKDSVEVNICELKKSPAIKRISEQLFSGYIHAKIILKMMNYNNDKINYNFRVLLINDIDNQSEFNRLPNTPKKTIPGKPINEETSYDRWKKGEILFNHKDYSFLMKINKHIMKEINQNDYQYELQL